jgi:orotidine-5'-phosphate decarboxylase
MTRLELFEQIKKKKSYLCIGLDTDITKIPKHLLDTEDPVYEFNRQIIEATHDLCVAYKPNLAFYESLGPKGLISLEKTLELIPKNIFTIADAKRGDIGNTSGLYARAFFEHYHFDSVTVAPYMGRDSVSPFLEYKDKWVILLALTSNKGSEDFQLSEIASKSGLSKKLFEEVLTVSGSWGNADNTMYVIGATHPEQFLQVRKLVPDHFLLVPGVGTQGGDLEGISRNGMNKQCGLLVNASRQVIYASSEKDFSKTARNEAEKIRASMETLLEECLK